MFGRFVSHSIAKFVRSLLRFERANVCVCACLLCASWKRYFMTLWVRDYCYYDIVMPRDKRRPNRTQFKKICESEVIIWNANARTFCELDSRQIHTLVQKWIGAKTQRKVSSVAFDVISRFLAPPALDACRKFGQKSIDKLMQLNAITKINYIIQ